MKTIFIIITYCILFLSSLLANANEFSGKVVHVSDGDTIIVLKKGKELKIRLSEIDCPEKKQAFGQKAKNFTKSRVAGKRVTVKVKSIDRYGRTVAEIILPDGKSLNRLLVKNGFAWWYSKYSNDKSLGQLEKKARKEKRGLWVDKHPTSPWNFRKNKKDRGKTRATRPASNKNIIYHCNIKSKVCHIPSCKYYNCKNCIQKFNSTSKLKKHGYRLHR